MSVGTPEYESRGRRRWPWRRMGVVTAVVVVIVLAARGVDKRVELGWDEVLGGRERRTTWRFFGFSIVQTKSPPGPLEQELRRRGIAWRPEWHTWAVRNESPWSLTKPVFAGSWSVPRRAMALDYLVRTSATDAELCAFLAVMESGTQEQREAALRPVEEKIRARRRI